MPWTLAVPPLLAAINLGLAWGAYRAKALVPCVGFTVGAQIWAAVMVVLILGDL